ncbi:hypothetical protein DFJ43DRAFT_1179168 [Lentinula guzmanii]|uniref:Uncharacterized protein n=1 Tax=Lentinula guzmanii TaxID=2804957 RepID=A0AA38JAE5_9AGAR|nr:hypothetical protein DFJ43DRAFT_1179168 [Lentinula guzmanii]
MSRVSTEKVIRSKLAGSSDSRVRRRAGRLAQFCVQLYGQRPTIVTEMSTLFHDSVAGPEVYTFLNKTTFLSVKTRKMVKNILNKCNDRNLDVHDMLIYNDFYGYAVLDIVDTTLAKSHTKVQEKEWDEAMLVAEALTHIGRYILSRLRPKVQGPSTNKLYLGVDDGDRRQNYTWLTCGSLLVIKSRASVALDATYNIGTNGLQCRVQGHQETAIRKEKEWKQEWRKKTLDKEYREDGNEDGDDEEEDKVWFSSAKSRDDDMNTAISMPLV